MKSQHIKQELRMFLIDYGIAKQRHDYSPALLEQLVDNSTQNILNGTNKVFGKESV